MADIKNLFLRGDFMKQRLYIDKKILLQNGYEFTTQAKTFHVIRKINEGGSVVCYEGYFNSSTNGILREFYPRNMAEFFERDNENQLFLKNEDSATKNIFQEQLDRYLQPYYMLREKRLEDPEALNFLPSFEIYFGATDNEKNSLKTAYIWTSEQSVETFEEICKKIHNRPNYKPETKLFIALHAIRSLTKCICSLHNAEFIHRDIKPSNFGFKKLNGEILPQTVSIFDIDTICSVYEDVENFVVSPGYVEPEFALESANNLTDIYSIGATLFSAIIVQDAHDLDYTFHEKDYNDLKNLVDNSKLITASRTNSAPKLRAILTEILKKTLCRRENRFETCEELLEKLNYACFYLMPAEFAESSYKAEKWILKEVEKSFDKIKEKNVLRAIQYHLYEYPLYRTMSADEKILNILIFGFGNYGQKFLDVCLQVSQMVDINVNATVVSDDFSDKEIYLNDRPALKDFFDIDEEKATCGQSYGKIFFKVKTISKSETAVSSDAVDDVILELCEKAAPHYVFVALGNDVLNKKSAIACRNALKALELKCLVNFAQEENIKSVPRGIIPICVNKIAKNSPLYFEIERMAFNAHLVWEKNLNIDYNVTRKNFNDPYNHDACVANVLSIKYKLHSIGIDIKKISDFAETAKIFVEKNLHSDGKKNTPEYNLRNKLIFVEHKRWIVEKICNGWTKRNLEDCADGITKDKKQRTHICIVTSRADRLLHDNYRAEDWDKISQKELEDFDELDKISVQLHQQFYQQAMKNKSHEIISMYRIIEDISAEFTKNMIVPIALSEFKVCLQDIFNGDRNKINLYENLKSVFKKSLTQLDLKSQENVKEKLRELENKVHPVLNSLQYYDYKQYDVALIDNIPFILTYSTQITLVIPYSIGNNSEFFGNVASATVINPEKIIYFALFENKSEINQFITSLSGLIKYFDRKNLRANIEFVIAIKNSAECSRITAKILELEAKKIRQVKVFPINLRNKIGFFKNYLNLKRKNKTLFLLEKNRTYLSGLLEGGKFYENFASYEFISLNYKFTSLNNCEFLNYINKRQFITANDLTDLNSSTGNFGEQPTFFEDYKILWKKYSENRNVWKELCNFLAEHSKNKDILIKLKGATKYTDSALAKEYTYLLPPECLRTVEDKVLKFLKAKNFIQDYSIHMGIANSFEVTIKDRFGNESEYKKLFANPYNLFQPDAIQIAAKPDEVSVIFDKLTVENFDLSKVNSNYLNKLLKLLEFFAEKKYLTNLNIKDVSKISFTYATRTIKNLLTVAGKILEIYVWHEVKNSGYFDDVISNFEFNWNNSDVKNEIDCIVIKNFKVLIIECKARSDIKQEFQHKLSAISTHLGINCKSVLIADTPKLTEEQFERSNAQNNIIVWKKEEVDNIAITLKKIIDGNYQYLGCQCF